MFQAFFFQDKYASRFKPALLQKDHVTAKTILMYLQLLSLNYEILKKYFPTLSVSLRNDLHGILHSICAETIKLYIPVIWGHPWKSKMLICGQN